MNPRLGTINHTKGISSEVIRFSVRPKAPCCPRLTKRAHRWAQPRERTAACAAAPTVPRTLDGDIDWDKVDWDTYDWRDYVEDERGPACERTLQALQWPAVCAQVATFAATFIGKKRCLNLEISTSPQRTLVRAAPARSAPPEGLP